MKRIKTEKGQALIIIAIAAVVLFGFAALTIDGSRSFSDRRHAQNAADTSALTAALAKIRNPTVANAARDAALARAASNSYDNNGVTNFVTVNSPPAYGPYSCAESPSTCEEYIQVIIKSHVPTTFARVLGWDQFTNTVDAVARAKGTINPGGDWRGAGLVAVKNDPFDPDKCFKVNGNADLTLHNTGIFVNCPGNSALFINGNPDIGMDADAQVAGCTNNPGFDTSPGNIVCNTPQEIVDASTFASVPTTLPTPSSNCTTPRLGATNPMLPGYYNNPVSISSTTTFTPGTYCFNAVLRLVGGGTNINGTGTVQMVLSEDLDLRGSANAFDDLEIYTNNASFTVFGTLTANRFRFFGNGNSDFGVQGGVFASSNAYIYSEAGMIDIQAQADVDLQAPPAGDTFAGYLIHTPWSNTNPFVLNGGTEDTMRGTILVPHSDVTFNGGSGFELHGQVIGYTITLNGSGHSDIYFDATANPTAPSNPSIEFTD